MKFEKYALNMSSALVNMIWKDSKNVNSWSTGSSSGPYGSHIFWFFVFEMGEFYESSEISLFSFMVAKLYNTYI